MQAVSDRCFTTRVVPIYCGITLLALLLVACGVQPDGKPTDMTGGHTVDPSSASQGASQNGSGANATALPSSGQVELDIFSGRPNPTWALSSEETQTLFQQMSALPHAEATHIPDTLGYRGFVVTFTAAIEGQWGACHTITTARVYRQTIELYDGNSLRYYIDKDRAIEQSLLASAQPHLSNDLLEQMRQSIGQ